MIELNGERLAYLDGGMGTLLQGMGLSGGERPESWNALHPDRVKAAHLAYLEAGADVIATNTFGATTAHLGADADALMEAGVRLAKEATREAGRGHVAIDMGSLGTLIEPLGDMPFEEAIRQFKRAFLCGIKAGGELILIETMTDLAECKAAVLGAKEALAEAGVSLPVWCSMSFDLSGRLLSGADIEGAVAMLAGLRVDAIGLNCGHEPSALLPNVKRLCACSPLPVFVSPNASLPVVKDGVTIYPTSPKDFARDMREIAALGAWGLGGCCGTTPEHIRALVEATKDMRSAAREVQPRCVVSGGGSALVLGGKVALIGERLNPTGKPKMKQALRDGDMDALLREAVSQLDAGADALDVNVGLPEIDEAATLPQVVRAVQGVCAKPLQIDTADGAALEAALRCYIGKPIVNSVTGKQSSMDTVFPLVARYGGAVVALLLNEQGIPPTVEGRLEIARSILSEAEKYGIAKHELLFDALTLTIGTDRQAANLTLETVRRLHDELGVLTVLGASNVSFGMPQRPLVNAAFLAMAVHAGLDAAIMNPGDALCLASLRASAALAGRDSGVEDYIEAYANVGKLGLYEEAQVGADKPNDAASTGASAPEGGISASAPLKAAILKGLVGEAGARADELLDRGDAPLAVVENHIMPALGEVGARYESGRLFLPQLLQSANAAQAAFDRVRARMPENSADDTRRIVLATVQGDVHDIGKNIVKVLLCNYGYTVIDLGRDVPPDKVVEAARRSGAPLVGLSALMTTTVPAMRDTIAALKRELPQVKTVVGGAVLTADYAAQIGADYYAADAMATVRVADSVFATKK